MKKQTLKQKDFDSYCIKQLTEATKTGAVRFSPKRNFFPIYDRIKELIEERFKDIEISLNANEIVLVKAQPILAPEKPGRTPLLKNAIYEPLRKSK